ncbi:hypothetical protein [Chondromyces crocatus]|uniref:Lipoprotein n=1 Tax=Chondromyces crocatus TaxID=52 RepID=A0A0K1E5K5_CHOCO|nr:hypothetical protein [Chondromyces crocatus]AKT36156.1 uncharacterized protein CMC5_002700 [Chondromyces crocatus]
MASLTAPLRLSALVLLGTFALCAGGCAKIGCFDYTEQEYEAFNGCPSQAEALRVFGDPNCGGEVESVDSEAEYRDGYCCYEITKSYDYYYDGICSR